MYLIVYGAVIVPFTTSAWFCDVTVYFHPSKVDVCPLTAKTYAKTNGWLFQHPIRRQVPAKNNNKSSGQHLNPVSLFVRGMEGGGATMADRAEAVLRNVDTFTKLKKQMYMSANSSAHMLNQGLYLQWQ